MVSLHKAHVIDAQELKEMLDESAEFANSETPKEKHNPALDRLMFIEAKSSKGTMSVYPCFVAGYAYDREPKVPEAESPKLLFDVYIVQCIAGKFGFLQVVIKEDELGNSKRFWDMPPTKDIREITAWIPPVEAEVQ